jgi:uncharacterized protein YdhG (YjbR/CyaY superfamily)
MIKAKSVDDYINDAPDTVKIKLQELRNIIKSSAPEAAEKISYAMPFYDYNGRLAYFAYTKNHIGLYIMPKVLEDFEEEVKPYRTGKATLRLNLSDKLPLDLIKRMIKRGLEKNKAS